MWDPAAAAGPLGGRRTRPPRAGGTGLCPTARETSTDGGLVVAPCRVRHSEER